MVQFGWVTFFAFIERAIVCKTIARIAPSWTTNLLPRGSVDWRAKHVLTPLKTQSEKCGSCWAYATLAAVEAQMVIQGFSHSPRDLATMPLLECNRLRHGCYGGSPHEAFEQLYTYGTMTERDHSYWIRNVSRCRDIAYHALSIRPRLVHAVVIPHNSHSALLDIIQYGPVVVTISTKGALFQEYRTGVYDSNCTCSEIDHAMTLVGVAVEHGYWILRNSWGSAWGEQGYMRISYQSAYSCGMLTQPLGVSIHADSQ